PYTTLLRSGRMQLCRHPRQALQICSVRSAATIAVRSRERSARDGESGRSPGNERDRAPLRPENVELAASPCRPDADEHGPDQGRRFFPSLNFDSAGRVAGTRFCDSREVPVLWSDRFLVLVLTAAASHRDNAAGLNGAADGELEPDYGRYVADRWTLCVDAACRVRCARDH